MYFKATMPQAGPMAFEILELQKAVTGAWLPFLFGHSCNTVSQAITTQGHQSLESKTSKRPILMYNHI